MRPKIILKFGGTSLMNEENITKAVNIIQSKQHLSPLVVVSALGAMDGGIKVTDALQTLVNQILNNQDYLTLLEQLKHRHIKVINELGLDSNLLDKPFEKLGKTLMDVKETFRATNASKENINAAYDSVMGFGEIFSSLIVASYLQSRNLDYVATVPEEINFITNDVYQNAEVLETSLELIASAVIASKSNLIVPGYIGINSKGKITTVGRGGSDYSAAIMGAALKKDVEIWTDVEGIFRANPKYFDDRMLEQGHPTTIPELSTEEAFQMAAFGSKVLYEKAIHATKWAAKKGRNINLYIKSTFNPNHHGTKISSVRKFEGDAKGITCLECTYLLTLYPKKTENYMDILKDLNNIKNSKIKISSYTTGRVSFVFDEYSEELDMLESKYEGHLSKDQILIKIVGDGLGENQELLAKIHNTLDFVENPDKYGMSLVHKTPLVLTENTFEIVAKKRGIKDLVLGLYKDLFMEKEIYIGMFGLGTIGKGVLKYANEIYSSEKTGYKLKFPNIVVRDLEKHKNDYIPGKLTKQWEDILDDNRIDVVIELIGGIEPARSIILSAFKKGKHVVTANKALLAECGEEIFKIAAEYKRNLGFEASVCGEIPVIDDFLKVPSKKDVIALEGIINGTSNYILTKISQGLEYETAIKEAQDKGFAEADPSFDIKGIDSSQKLAILSSIIFNQFIDYKKIPVKGIENIKRIDCIIADDLGFAIKPIALARRIENGLVVMVSPCFVSKKHSLYSIHYENNAVSLYLRGRDEPSTRIGKGAGAIPTARSILRDVIEVAKKAKYKMLDLPKFYNQDSKEPLINEDDFEYPFYLRFTVKDIPGVFGRIATILGDFNISIKHAVQKEAKEDYPSIFLMVKNCKYSVIKTACTNIKTYPFLHELEFCPVLE